MKEKVGEMKPLNTLRLITAAGVLITLSLAACSPSLTAQTESAEPKALNANGFGVFDIDVNGTRCILWKGYQSGSMQCDFNEGETNE